MRRNPTIQVEVSQPTVQEPERLRPGDVEAVDRNGVIKALLAEIFLETSRPIDRSTATEVSIIGLCRATDARIEGGMTYVSDGPYDARFEPARAEEARKIAADYFVDNVCIGCPGCKSIVEGADTTPPFEDLASIGVRRPKAFLTIVDGYTKASPTRSNTGLGVEVSVFSNTY